MSSWLQVKRFSLWPADTSTREKKRMIKTKSEEDLLFGSSSPQGQIIPNWMFFDILSSLSKASTEEGIWAKTKQIWQNCLEKLTFFQLQAKEH